MQLANHRAIILNAVLIITTALMIAPDYSASEHTSVVATVFGTLLICSFLRTPGAFAESGLIRRGRIRSIYVVYIIALALTSGTVFSNHYKTTGDELASGIGIFLFYSSLILSLAIAITAIASRVRRANRSRDKPTKKTEAAGVAVHQYSFPRQQPRYNDAPLRQTWRYSRRAVPRAEPVGTSDGEKSHAATRSREPMQNQIGLALGIITGIVGIIQGFNSQDVYRTVIAIAIGSIGVVIIYVPAIRKHVSGRHSSTGAMSKKA